MKYPVEWAPRLANLGIWSLICFGLFLELLVIPILSNELPNTFTQLEGDGLIIQLGLLSITVVSQVILVSISILLRKITKGKLLSYQAAKWVSTLFIGTTSLTVLLALFFGWLTGQDATGPAVAFSFIGGILLLATVSLVTLSLKSVLEQAISNKVELEAVI